jgi:hypothetical protein
MRNRTLSRHRSPISSSSTPRTANQRITKRIGLLTLPIMALLGCTPKNTGEFFDALANVPEMMSRTVQIQVNHQARTICVAGVLRNIGGKDIKGPFKVAIGTTFVKNGVTISKETRVDVPASVTIAKNGGEYVTECDTSELVYRDEVPGFIYNLEILADFENVIPEFDDWGNNRFKIDWWTLSPKA